MATRFNEQVKNNSEKFDDDFMFRLTESEFENLISKKSTSSGGGRRKLPYAFTEQGIYMLMTVLRGELAVRQSKALIRMFKQMKDFIVENQDFINSKDLVQISIQTNQNTNDIKQNSREISELNSKMNTLATKEDLKKVMDNFIDLETYKHFLLMNGDKIEADVAYTKIYKSAKKSIYLIDNYIGLKTLKTPQNKEKNLVKLGILRWVAHKVANTGNRIAHMCHNGWVQKAISTKRLTSFGLVSMLDYYTSRCVTC